MTQIAFIELCKLHFAQLYGKILLNFVKLIGYAYNDNISDVVVTGIKKNRFNICTVSMCYLVQV